MQSIATRHTAHETLNHLAGREMLGLFAMTAHAMQGDRELCLAVGMNDYITKPVSPQALVEVLDKWLQKDSNE